MSIKKKREAERVAQQLEIQRHITGMYIDIRHAKRSLLYSGALKRQSDSSWGTGSETKHRHMYLFSDIVLLVVGETEKGFRFVYDCFASLTGATAEVLDGTQPLLLCWRS